MMSNTRLEPAATIALVNPDNTEERAVFGLFATEDRLKILDIVLLEEQSSMPAGVIERFIKQVYKRAEDLNFEFIEGRIKFPLDRNSNREPGEWKIFSRDPNGPRIFNDKQYGGLTFVQIKTTIDPTRVEELRGVLENTYGRERATGPETV